MKISTLALLAAMSVSTVASADDANHPYRPDISGSLSTPVRIGFGMDFGIPSGGAIGVVVQPKLDWMRIEGSVTYNYLTFGGRASVQLDPLAVFPHFPIGVFGDVQAGFFPDAIVPGHGDLPKVGYDYLNLYAGLRLGKPQVFHWTIEAGPTFMHITTGNFQSLVGATGGTGTGVAVGNPTINGWFFPTFMTGFEIVWPN